MKLALIIIAALALNGCNTLIGIGRDTKECYYWTKNKLQQSGGSGSGEPHYEEVPVY